ncbi:MAG: hypothetical protein LBE92_10940 [Chryseobacterium sp.]|jgi:hypothetical protein|uniref:hypothetical protein n=1 Tax=Chryseobacterium sp. TaxID=1871047 RepID=UPI00282AA926|nr:hypothetical protein [Chryseobacterium sp.]MDR2236630.1 hypothetical protein [Chryseobacterium sp.]
MKKIYVLCLSLLTFFACKETDKPSSQPETAPAKETRAPEKKVPETLKTDSPEIPEQKIPLPTTWNGKYFGTFLRLKDESADPRAWGQINLDINGKKAVFKLDTYVEILEKDLEVQSETSKELQLKEPATGKQLTLTRTDRIILEGNLMESIVGEHEKYEIKKQ